MRLINPIYRRESLIMARKRNLGVDTGISGAGSAPARERRKHVAASPPEPGPSSDLSAVMAASGAVAEAPAEPIGPNSKEETAGVAMAASTGVAEAPVAAISSGPSEDEIARVAYSY